jgi:hypothetical protein
MAAYSLQLLVTTCLALSGFLAALFRKSPSSKIAFFCLKKDKEKPTTFFIFPPIVHKGEGCYGR